MKLGESAARAGPSNRLLPQFCALLLCSAAVIGSYSSAIAQGAAGYPRNMYGSTGLVDMPSARMAPDGELSLDVSFTQNIQHYSLGFQALPWLETNFRYSGLQHFDPDTPANPSFPVYYDRSFAAKIRLFKEGAITPALAIGANDIVGTGIYGSEYFVASKQFGPIDATIGMGWGRLSSNFLRNPLTLLSSSFATSRALGTPGATDFRAFFHGPKAGLFGGLSWATPVEGLTLLTEYSSDAYQQERLSNTFTPRNHLNFAAHYQVSDGASVGLSWLYGDRIGANLSFHFDPSADAIPQRLAPPVSEPRIREPKEQAAALDRLAGRASLASRKFENGEALADLVWKQAAIRDVNIRGRVLELTVIGADPAQACKDTASLAERYGVSIETVAVQSGTARAHCAVHSNSPPIFIRNALSVPAVYTGAPGFITIDARQPAKMDVHSAISTIDTEARRQDIQIEAISFDGAVASVYFRNDRYFAEHEALSRLIRIMMANSPAEVEQFRFVSAPQGQPQREFDVLRTPAERSYLNDIETRFDDAIDTRPAPMSNPVLDAADRRSYPHFSWDIFPQFRQQLFDPSNPAGLQLLGAASASLELSRGLSLYGEVEGSIFDTFSTGRISNSALQHVRTDFLKYFVEGKNGIGQLEADYTFRLSGDTFAIARAGYLESMFSGVGGEFLWRPENQRWALGLDGYQVWQRSYDRLFGIGSYHVFTGHASLYYASPIYDLNFAVRVGQYLAGDRGFTLEITRRFATGIEIGAFMTTTNVSAAQFGEGSFDKGIMIRIPIGAIIPIETQRQFNMDLRPVQRDGGQRISGDTTLYEGTRRGSLEEMTRRAQLTPP